MSGAMGLIIASACVGLSGSPQQACQKAIEAGGKQTGIEQNLDKAQDKVQKAAEETAKDVLGNETIEVIGGTVFLAKTISDKSVKFDLPTLGLCDKIVNEVGTDKYSLQMIWRLK